jgi:hypothetical protein
VVNPAADGHVQTNEVIVAAVDDVVCRRPLARAAVPSQSTCVRAHLT